MMWIKMLSLLVFPIVHLMLGVSYSIHAFQEIYGCYMHDNGTTTGFIQLGFDGEDFISFDKDTLTWTAAMPSAVFTKNKWDYNVAGNLMEKGYLEKDCIDWLKKYIKYGQATLEQKVQPEMKMTEVQTTDNIKLKCTVTGFYPQDIDVYFVKDYEERIGTAVSSGVLPNSDKTYYIETRIKIDPQDKYQYYCHVEHESFKSKLTVKLESGSSNVFVLCITVVILVAAVVAVAFWRMHQKGSHI